MMKASVNAVRAACALLLWLGATEVSAQQILRVCSLPLPPQTMLNAKHQPDGLAVKILQQVAPPLHWQLRIHYMPWLRVVAQAKRGQCDLVLTVLHRQDYESYMRFPKTAVLDQSNVLLVRQNSAILYHGDLEAFMRAHSIGLYSDKAVDQDFERLRVAPWARIDLADSTEQNMQKLVAGRFDAALENELSAMVALLAFENNGAVNAINDLRIA